MTEGTDVKGRPAEGFEHGPDTRHWFVVASDHENEHAALSPDGPARQGCLDQGVARAGQALAEPAHHCGAVRGQVHEDGARCGAAGPVRGHAGDDIGGGQGQQRDLGPAAYIGRVGGDGGAGAR